MHEVFRTKGVERAKRALIRLLEAAQHSLNPDIQRMRQTLIRWREAILAYFNSHARVARAISYSKLTSKTKFGISNFSTAL